jgi:hypothetical protein
MAEAAKSGWPLKRRLAGIALGLLVLAAVTLSFDRVRYRVLGRNPCGHRPIPANVLGVLGDGVTIRGQTYVDACTTAVQGYVPYRQFTIEPRSTDRTPQIAVATAMLSAGWRECSWSPGGDCLQSPNRHYNASFQPEPDGMVAVIVGDLRNKVDCNKGCG